MRQKTITITISKTGEVTFEVNGVPGKACTGETKFLEDALGGGIVDQEKTDEYYKDEETVDGTVSNKDNS